MPVTVAVTGLRVTSLAGQPEPQAGRAQSESESPGPGAAAGNRDRLSHSGYGGGRLTAARPASEP